ncbi:MAG TPA: hypothetical protein VGJ00_05235 [Rhabdochlamydiaceae bacterium]
MKFTYALMRFFLVAILLSQPGLFSEDAFFVKKEILIAHVKASIAKAQESHSTLNNNVFSIRGFSSAKVRRLLNSLCSLNGGTYLEIGCCTGSTFVPAVYGNQQTLRDIIAIDNWSEFEGPRSTFFKNVNRFLEPDKLRFFETDCFSINVSTAFPHPVSIYFYDGNHSEKSQRAAFTHFNPIFDDVFIAVVDDWNWQQVQRGTFQAFEELQYKVHYQQEFLTTGNNPDSWWNGLYIAVIEK